MTYLSNHSSIAILSLGLNTVIGLINASLFVAIFRYDYLQIGKRHRQITHVIGILSIAYQIILEVYLITKGHTEYCCMCIALYSLMVATVMAEMHFVSSMSPICPVVTKFRIKVIKTISWILYVAVTMIFIARLILEQTGDHSDTLNYVLEYTPLAETVFSSWCFIATDPIRIYSIYCVTKFTNERKKQSDELTRYLQLVRKYSTMNLALDVVLLAMSFSVYVPMEGWDELNDMAATLIILHAVIYCFLLSTIVKLIFPNHRLAGNGIKPKTTAAVDDKMTRVPDNYQLNNTMILS